MHNYSMKKIIQLLFIIGVIAYFCKASPYPPKYVYNVNELRRNYNGNNWYADVGDFRGYYQYNELYGRYELTRAMDGDGKTYTLAEMYPPPPPASPPPSPDPNNNGENIGGSETNSDAFDCFGTLNGTFITDLCGRCVAPENACTTYDNPPITPPDPLPEPPEAPPIVPPSPPQANEEEEVDNNRAKDYYLYVNDNKNKKYNTGDTIYLPKGNNAKFTIAATNNNTIDAQGLQWKRKDAKNKKDTLKCSNETSCTLNIAKREITTIKVDSTGNTNLIKCYLVVYNTPVIRFTVSSNYAGTYGFDDSAHQYLKDSVTYKRGYEIARIPADSNNYTVPWMSLLHNSSGTIGVQPIGNDSDIVWAKKDEISKAKFDCDNEFLLINNNNTPYELTYKELFEIGVITIKGVSNNKDADSLKLLHSFVLSGANTDTLGKMTISCAEPVRKKVLFINVKTGNNGYRSINKQAMLDSLNHNSHNQLFRQWELYTPTQDLRNTYGDSVINSLDSIDLSVEYAADPIKFFDTLLIRMSVNRWYKKHKNNLSLLGNVNNYNALNKKNFKDYVYIVFVLNIPVPPTKPTETPLAKAETAGLLSYLGKQANMPTIVHELGHLLNLNHTFSETDDDTGEFSINFGIPKYQTRNFMDYSRIGTPTRNMFYYAQWINVY